MNVKLTLLGILIFVGTVLFTASRLKTEETTVSASYQMLACEKCFHMTVVSSQILSFEGVKPTV